MEKYGHKVISTDISLGCDFLTKTIYDGQSVDAIITNPPFSLADRFIRKSTTLAPISAMLLKSQYFYAAKRYDLFREQPPAYVLPLTWRPDFYEHERAAGEKGSPTMDVIWVVWIRGDYSSKYIPLLKPN